MTAEEPAELRPSWPDRAACAIISLAAMAALLLLDGRLGPFSFTLRRAAALMVLAIIAATTWARRGARIAAAEISGTPGDTSPSRDAIRLASTPRRLIPPIAGPATVIATLVIVARAPSVPIALVGFLVALAAIGSLAGSRSPAGGLAAGLVPACLTYVGLRFMVDLVPQVGAVGEAVAGCGSHYIRYARGIDARLSYTALGGPALGMAVPYLLYGLRWVGGNGRAVAAIVIPLAWFALLPAVTPEVADGPIAVFSRGAFHGLFWLGVAGFIGAAGRMRPGAAPPQDPGVQQPQAVTGDAIVVGLLSALAGVCLVGTAYVGPAAARSVRVYNSGGLDWDRPVFGRFGPFSGGMFGLWPVYCRAEGYDFDVIDKGTRRVSKEAPAPDEISSGVRRGPTEPARKPTEVLSGSDSTSASPRTVPSVAAAYSKDDPSSDRGSEGAPRVRPTSTPAALAEETIEPADLEKTQILVLINSPKEWKDAERQTVLEFVARGGSLLVLGDHTDVFGLMRGFNSLLGPMGIRFRFDSAYKVRETWRGCEAAGPDSVASGWDDENPGVAVGASLELSGNARPLLVGRYAFSDAGVRENAMGSFLGNYRYDSGERLGDVVLVATAAYGGGRVVVWGDTSAFQGVSSYYPAVVGPILAWLSRPAAWTERPQVRAGAALGLLAAIAWLWRVRGGVRGSAVIGCCLLLGLAIPWWLGTAHREARVRIGDDVALIDRSHLPASGHYGARINPIGPLYTNLLRSGFRVAEMRDWDPAMIARAKAITFIAPQRSFTAAEVKDLWNAEERGAVVILTTGQPDSAGSRRLLDSHGLALQRRPLGTISSADPAASRLERETHPRFLDAWPIVTREGGNPVEVPGVAVIFRHGKDVVALFRRVGHGGLLLISDTRFFSDMNVEDVSGYWPGNLALIRDLFGRYLGAEPDAVLPLFRSPKKPQ